MKRITTRQLEVLRSIHNYIERAGRPPTIRELCSAHNVASTYTMTCHLRALIAKRMVVKSVGSSRGLAITTEGTDALGLSGAPYTLREWDATQEPDVTRIRATIAALERRTRRKAVAA